MREGRFVPSATPSGFQVLRIFDIRIPRFPFCPVVRELVKSWTSPLFAVAPLLLIAVSCEPLDAHEAKLDGISPNRFVDPSTVPPPPSEPPPRLSHRSIDGSNNHPEILTLGAAGTPLRRASPPDYADGIGSMAGHDRPSARVISNAVCADTQAAINVLGASDMLWQWGQFLDHDIDLTEANAPFGPAHILPETGDTWFDPESTGLSQIDFFRSSAYPGTGVDIDFPRQQRNDITHYIDASNVYGSDEERATALRTMDGTGMLKTSAGNLLPFNVDGLENAGGTQSTLFLGGDIRANEQAGLTAMHVLFVREHNRLAQEIAANDPLLTGEEIYQEARKIVGAQMQVITYNEFLPALLGPDAIDPYDGYDIYASPSIMNVFSSAIYRFGHSALSPTLLRLDASGNEIPFGHLSLRNAFFAPHRIINEGGIEPLLRGLAAQPMSRVDTEIVDDVRNFLFGSPGQGGLDLGSLNIQRGRDHGLPSYADTRWYWGLAVPTSFADVSSDPAVQARLASVYDTVDDIDLWVGALAEDPIPGAHVGELSMRVIKNQFENLRNGDFFWYTNVLSAEQVAEVEATTLADIIRRNTSIGSELSDDVFAAN